jgi:hypothetical protein
MCRCYWQIFLTYVRGRIYWLVGLMLLIGCGLLLGAVLSGKREVMGDPDMPYAGVGFFFFGYFGMVVFHLKQQIALPQASLIPGYRVPQLVVALVMTLPMLVVVPVVASVGFGLPILPLLSLVVAFSALLAWGICRGSGAAIVLAVGCWFLPALPAVHRLFLDRFVTDHSLTNSLTALPVLALGVGGLALVGRRLLALKEEMPGYAKNSLMNRSAFWSDSRGTGTAVKVNFDTWWWRFVYGPNERQLGGPGVHSGAGFWRRVAHWRTAYASPRMMFPAVIMFALMFMFGIHFSTTEGASNMVGGYLYLMPAFIVCIQQYGRWPMLGYESLRPVTRRDFVLENGAGVALHMAQVWLTMASALVAVAAALSPGLLGGGELWRSLAASALAQVPATAIVWWLLRVRVRSVLIGMAMVGGASFAPLSVFTRDLWAVPPGWGAAVAGAVVVVGAVIAWDAYRRWMRADLA